MSRVDGADDAANPSPATPAARLEPRTALKGASVAMMLGPICPWATFLGLASASGLAVSFGWVPLLSGAAILWLTVRPAKVRRHRRTITLILVGLSALSCLLVILGLSGSQDGIAVQASWGVYFTLLACVTAGWSARRALAG